MMYALTCCWYFYFLLLRQLYASRPNEIVDPPISLDLPRTFPYHPKFGKDGTHIQALRNVLVAYANFNPALGYCQGMSFIAAMLLMHLEEEVNISELLNSINVDVARILGFCTNY